MSPTAVAILDTELAHTRRRIAALQNHLQTTSDPTRRLKLLRILERLVESANRLAWGAAVYSGDWDNAFPKEV